MSRELDHKRICVLGGGGFLGSHLVEALLSRTAAEVVVMDTCLDRLGGVGGASRLTVERASVSDEGALAEVVSPCDLVVSTTALCNPSLYNTRPAEVIEANFTHLAPLVELCTAREKRLVHLSTCEVYGRGLPDDPDAPLHEDHTPLVLGPVHRERWTYACAKQLLERLIWARGRHDGLLFTIVRPFNVIGPRMDYLPGVDGEGIPRVLACFMGDLLEQRPLRLVDGGWQRRAFISVADFTVALLAVLAAPGRCQGEVLNIGNPGNDVSIADLAALMIRLHAEHHGGDPELGVEEVSAAAFYGIGYDDVLRRVPDVSKALRLLDWEPSASLEQMLPGIMVDYVARYGDRIPGGER